MATVFRKTGFWIFGATTRHEICDRCREEIQKIDGIPEWYSDKDKPSGERYCRRCAISLGIDLEPHDWPSDIEITDSRGSERLFRGMTNKADGQEKYIESCFHCNALLVATIRGTNVDRSYYSVGKTYPTRTKPQCTRRKMELIGGHLKNQLTCHHNFVEVANSRDQSTQEKEYFQDLGETQIHTKVLETTNSGRRNIWCSKCGLYYDLPIYRETKLKAVGINTDWYVK
jgi:hypothetical protein